MCENVYAEVGWLFCASCEVVAVQGAHVGVNDMHPQDGHPLDGLLPQSVLAVSY